MAAQNEGLRRLVDEQASQISEAEREVRLTRETIAELDLENTEGRRVEAALTIAKNAAEATSKAKDQFLRNMSHELRTPINGVLGMTLITLDTDLTEEQREYLSVVKDSADSLLALINNVLDHSAMDHRELTLQPILFSLGGFLAELKAETEPKSAAKDLELKFETGPGLQIMVNGDSLRLKQVLTNVIDNAVKFTSQGTVTVKAWVRELESDSIELVVSVIDTGIGMSPEQQRKMFDAFSQADVSDTRQYGGIGLGLALSSQLIKMMGGQICAESEAGRGTTFSFSAVLGLPREGALC